MFLLSRYLLALLIVLSAVRLPAQTIPTKCLEIESILVDACTSGGQCDNVTEGENEMVRFIVGPDPIAIGDLDVDWPNNSFNGIAQNATTASLTAALNATIEGCGHLVEPPAGIIPAGKRVLLVTSTDMCVQANSFAALTDTLYLIFQEAGNVAGHFGNQNNGGTISPTPTGAAETRTLIITFTPSGCADTATYSRPDLTNIFGTYGGTPAENDGATAVFSWPGTPQVTYVNNGCQAPFVPLLVEIATAPSTIGCGGSVDLNAAVSGSFASVLWSGGSGTFTTPDQNSATYTVGNGDSGATTLYFCASGSCGQGICDSVTFTVNGSPNAQIDPPAPLVLCPGSTLQLIASGGDTYLWNTQANTPSITVDQPGTYSVAVTNACGTANVSATVVAATPPVATISGNTVICPNASTLLTAAGGSAFTWSTGQTTTSISVNSAGTYSVVVSDGCSSGSASTTITTSTFDLSATASPLSGTPPLAVDLSTTSDPAATSWAWNFGDGGTSTVSTPAHVFDEAGTYLVTVFAEDANGCESSATLTIVVSDIVPSSVLVPNVFSPNGDGVNDQLQVISTGLSTLNVVFFNRWGQTVGAIKNPAAVWDGRDESGVRVSEGTYFYRLLAEGLDGRSYELTGSVTVLR